MAKKKNWESIEAQKPEDSVQYRDVYEDQQLERGKIADKQTITSRLIITLVLAALIFVLAYVILSIGSYGVSQFMSFTGSVSTEEGSLGDGTQSGSSSGYEDSADSQLVKDVLGEDWVQPAYEEFIDPMIGFYWIDENGVRFDDHEPGPMDYVKLRLAESGQTIEDFSNKAPDESPEDVSSGAGEETAGTTESTADAPDLDVDVDKEDVSFYACFAPTWWKVIASFLIALIFWSIIYRVMVRNLEAQNLMNDTSDINQYHNDQHIALPEETQRKFDIFPDVGAHSNVQVSSMISHMAISNKGLKKIMVAKRAKKDIKDEEGNLIYAKGEAITTPDGEMIMETVPMIDTDFTEALFTASGLPEGKNFRHYYDPTQIPYNPGGKIRSKQGGAHDTVADLINNDWEFPVYEVQRPGGIYMVDTEPVNTMVLAITRAGKGQTIIEKLTLCLFLLLGKINTHFLLL